MTRTILPIALLVVAIVLFVLAVTYDGNATYIALGGTGIAVVSVFVALNARRSR